MAKPYSEDLRRRVVEAVEDGATIPEAAEQFGVSISSVVRFLRLHRDTGSIRPSKFGGYMGYALAAHEERVRRLVAEQPDITLAELRARLAKEKVTVGQSSISSPAGGDCKIKTHAEDVRSCPTSIGPNRLLFILFAGPCSDQQRVG